MLGPRYGEDASLVLYSYEKKRLCVKDGAYSHTEDALRSFDPTMKNSCDSALSPVASGARFGASWDRLSSHISAYRDVRESPLDAIVEETLSEHLDVLSDSEWVTPSGLLSILPLRRMMRSVSLDLQDLKMI